MESCQYVIVDDRHRVIEQSHDSSFNIEIHSCAKPFQMMPVCLLDLDKKYDLSSRELAIMSSSSLAQDQHIEVIKKLLDKTKVHISDLQICATAPTGTIAYENWKKRREEKSPLYHPCVGNHIAMYLAQRELTGEGEGYLRQDSAIQNMIFRLMKESCGDREITVGVDSCGAPCYRMTMKALAIAYSNLCKTGESCFSKRYQRTISSLRRSFESFPILLEGEECLSTVLSGQKGIFGKTGANGTLGICVDNYKYGIALFSPTCNWADAANTVYIVFKKIGYHSDTLYAALDEFLASCQKYGVYSLNT